MKLITAEFGIGPLGVNEGLYKGGYMVPEKTIERLSIYRRMLAGVNQDGKVSVYSHDLAAEVGGTAAQVRRDLMAAGVSGNSRTGYQVAVLLRKLDSFLDSAEPEKVLLVGVGNLGRALIQFFEQHHRSLRIVAALDTDPRKAGRVLSGVRCFADDELEAVVKKDSIRLAVLAVPVSAAQKVADRLVRSGIAGILNFVPVPLKVPRSVKVEGIDMTMALEKLAYLVRNKIEENS